MSGKPPTIGVLFSSTSDRRLLRDFLQEEGYSVFSPEIGEGVVADLAGVDLILVEGKVAKRFRDALINLKNRVGAAFSFLPILVAQPSHEPAGPWLAAGFDDVIPLPVVKPLLSVRIKTWLRIREETAGRFRALVEESSIGFYRTTPDGRVLYANPAFVRLLGFSSFTELAQHNLEELAQRVGYPRARFKEILEREGRVEGFECMWVRHHGRPLWIRESAHVVRDEFGRVLYYEGTVEDITARVEAQQAYSTVVENSLQGIAVLQDGRIVFGNPALEELSGRSLTELLSMTPAEVLGMVHPADRPWVAENMRRRLLGEPVPPVSEFRFIHKDGNTRWVRALARRIEFAGRPAIVVSYVDITQERRLAERLNAVGELGRKLVLSRALEEVAQAAVEGACALVGFTDVSLFLVDEKRGELVLLARSLGEPHGPRRLPLGAERGVVVRAARTGTVQNIPDVDQEPGYIRAYPQNRSEIAVPLKVGDKVIGVLNVESERPAAFGPEEERVLTTLADVAAVALENARLFREIEELRRFHEGIVQTLAEGVVLVDAEGRVAFANPMAARLMGYEVAEVLGKHWRDFVAPPFWDFVEEQRRRRAQGETGEYEILLLRKDGSTFPALVHARPLLRDGEFLGSLVAFTDVSLLKEFETRYRYFAEQTEEGFYCLELKEPIPADLPVEEQVQRLLSSAVLAEANDAFARHYGFPRASELHGRGFSELGLYMAPEELMKTAQEFLENGGRLAGRELRVTLPNGEERWLAYTAVGLHENGKLRAIWGTQRDITARRMAEERLKRQIQRLTVLHRASQEILQSLAEPERVYEAVHRAVAELMPAEAFVIALKHSEDEAEGVYLFDKGGRLPPQRIPKGQGLTWHILGTGKSLLVRDLTVEEVPAIHFGTAEPVCSLLAVPLKVGEETIGMLSTQSYRPGVFSAEDLTLLELFAAHAAATLHNAQLLEELQKSEAKYRRLVESIPGVVYLLDLDQPFPRRTVYISPQIERLLGFTVEEWLRDPELWIRQIDPADRDRVVAAARELNEARQPYDLTYRVRIRDGRLVWIRNLASVLPEASGRPRFAQGIMLDVTSEVEYATRLRQVLDQTVEALSAAMEIREPYTAGHQRRVAELACAIAEEMGLTSERVRGLRVAALLHDIGKALFVPIEILSKPGKLTDLEMALIREHPKAGYEVLKKVEFPWPVAEMVYQHHERLDGSGYPRGLKGDEILLEARLLAVADVVEAMSSFRPYRPALGVDAALAEIREKAGTLYDPAVVAACLQVFAKGFQFPRVTKAQSS